MATSILQYNDSLWQICCVEGRMWLTIVNPVEKEAIMHYKDPQMEEIFHDRRRRGANSMLVVSRKSVLICEVLAHENYMYKFMARLGYLG